MRIIYVTSSLPHGKKEAFIIPEIRELQRQGHEVLIVPTYPRGAVLHGDAEPLMRHVVSKPLLSAGIAKAAVRQFVENPTGASEVLRCLFRSRSSGLLLRNLVVYPKGLWLADLALDWRADHIHAHWSTVPATMAFVAGEVSKVPWSITTHRFDIVENNLLETKTKKACFVRAISRRGAREISERVDPETAAPSVIHMGVAIPPAEDVERRQDQERTPRVVVPANLLEVKGHAYLLKAVRNLKDRGLDLEVDIAGDGPLRQELLGEVEKLELRDRVSFLGLVPHEKLLDRMKLGSWDILVLPSIVTDSGEKEGIPVAIIEAMSCRVPVVSTQTGGIPELFEGVEDALLVPPRDPAALAEAIERLVTNPDLRERLIESGRRQVEDRFAVERVAAELARRFEMCRTHRREGIRSQ
jgi:colanic acid/amylovoran biosynthesis glycosyltransferase